MSNLSEESKKNSSLSEGGGGWNFHIDHVENLAFMEDVFTPEECQKIIEIGNNLIEFEGNIFGNNNNIRKSSVSWIYPNQESSWIFRKLTDAVMHLNSQYFGFNLFSFSEGLQFTRYYEPDGHYSMHIDKTTRGSIRKLSISIQLNDSSEFEGGDLLFHFGSSPQKPEMKQGKMAAFPSYVLHEVNPVTRGIRYSLVAWISGPPFR